MLNLQLHSLSSFSSSEKREIENLKNKRDRLENALITTVRKLKIIHLKRIQDGFNLKSQHFNLKSKKSKLNNFIDPLDKDENVAIGEVRSNKNERSKL